MRKKWLLPYLFVVFMAKSTLVFAQISSTTQTTYASLNPKTDTNVGQSQMIKLNYKELFELDKALRTGGIIADNFGSEGKIELSVYNYDPTKQNGKGLRVYYIYNDGSSTEFVGKTINIIIDLKEEKEGWFDGVVVQSNAIKEITANAKLFVPDQCKVPGKLTWRESIQNMLFKLSIQNGRNTPACLEYYNPMREVIVEVKIKNATLHQFKIPGLGSYDAATFFNYQDKIRSLENSGISRFAIIGDEGCDGWAANKVAALVKNWNPEYILGMGDDNYEDIYKDSRFYGKYCGASIDNNCGKYYHEYIYPYHGIHGEGSSNGVNRFWSVLGNHDYNLVDGSDSDYLLYEWLNFFTYPNNERYYDKKIDDVHIFALNTNVEKDGTANDPDGRSIQSTQAMWLKDKLEKSDAKYKFVISHVPPYASANPDGSHGSDPVLQWPYELWGASIVMSGDQHYYERNKVDGFTYIVNGLGGHNVINQNVKNFIPENEVHYSAFHGAILAEIKEDHILCTLYNINYQKIDEFRIDPLQPSPKKSALDLKATSRPEVQLFPNPSDQNFKLVITSKDHFPVQLQIVNISGQLIQTQELQVKPGENLFDFESLKLTNGIYFIHIFSNQLTSVKKLIIK